MYKISNPNIIKMNYKKYISNAKCSICNTLISRYYIFNDEKLCYLCYIVNNIGFFNNNIIICHSKLSQLDINKLVFEYIKSNNTLPSPKNIDNDIKLVDLTLFEFSRIIMNDINILNKLNIKLMFTNLELYNLGLASSVFDDDNNDNNDNNDNKNNNDNENKNNNSINLEYYNFTKKEIRLIKNAINK